MRSDQESASRLIKSQYEEFRKNGLSPQQAWDNTYEYWTEQNPTNAEDPQQSWKSASGKAFELIVLSEIEQQVASLTSASTGTIPLKVYSWGSLPKNIQTGILAAQVWKPGTTESVTVPSQVDVVVVVETPAGIQRVIAVYSCKSSTAERYQQDLYWAERFRERRIRFCLVTLEKNFIQYATSPEASEDASRRKDIPLASALYDRIYLLTDEPIYREPQVFRPLTELGNDLNRWSEEP